MAKVEPVDLSEAYDNLDDILAWGASVGATQRWYSGYESIDPGTGNRRLYVIPSLSDVMRRGTSLEDFAAQLAEGRFSATSVDNLQDGTTGRFVIVDDKDFGHLLDLAEEYVAATTAFINEHDPEHDTEELRDLRNKVREAERLYQAAELGRVHAEARQHQAIHLPGLLYVAAFLVNPGLFAGVVLGRWFLNNRIGAQNKYLIRSADYKRQAARERLAEIRKDFDKAQDRQGEYKKMAQEASEQFVQMMEDDLRNINLHDGADAEDQILDHMSRARNEAREQIHNAGLRPAVQVIWRALGKQVIAQGERGERITRQYLDKDKPMLDGQVDFDAIAAYLTRTGDVSVFNLSPEDEARVKGPVQALYEALKLRATEFGWNVSAHDPRPRMPVASLEGPRIV